MKRGRDWVANWDFGLGILFFDDCISFYAYFSALLAEIACLWAFFPEIAVPFTVLNILCILNVLVCSFYKGRWEGDRKEAIFARVYLIAFAVIFAVGFSFGWLADIILFIAPFIFVVIYSGIREFAAMCDRNFKTVKFLQKILGHKAARVIGILTVASIPFVVFVLCLCQTVLHPVLKIVIAYVYVFLIPVICYIEDDFSACTVFELGFDITWSKEREARTKELEELRINDPEAFKEEVISALENFKEIAEVATGENKEKPD